MFYIKHREKCDLFILNIVRSVIYIKDREKCVLY